MKHTLLVNIRHKSIGDGHWATRMHKLCSSGVLRDGVARVHAPGGPDVRVEMSHPPQNRHAVVRFCVHMPCTRSRWCEW